MKVVAVLVQSKLDRGALGMLGAAQGLADALSARLEVYAPASVSDADQIRLAAWAETVFLHDQLDSATAPPDQILATLQGGMSGEPPRAIVFGNGTYAQELAPRLACRLGGASVGDAQKLAVVAGELQVTRAVYGGKASATIEISAKPSVVWIRARSFDGPTAGASRGAVTMLDSQPSDGGQLPRLQLLERRVESVDGVRLEEAQVVVSGGRGLGGPEPFERLKALAVTLKGEMAASRAACDLGWVPHSWQVGQTGKKVAPELYLAVALSGASQHLMGIADAKNIVAINNDPDAPIFKHARFGIVEDYDRVVDLLCEKLVTALK